MNSKFLCVSQQLVCDLFIHSFNEHTAICFKSDGCSSIDRKNRAVIVQHGNQIDYRFIFSLWRCIDVKKVIKKAIKKLEKSPQADPVFAAFQKRLQLLDRKSVV